MKVALCAIAKNEDKYVDHWVKHYFDRGFDHICIYDNNDDRDLIVQDKRVEVINCHGKQQFQMPAYKKFYEINKDKFDWIAYFDLDEYLECSNIKNLLNNMPDDIEQLQVKLANMSDSGFLYADYNVSPYERFTEFAPFQWHTCKAIIKTTTKNLIFKSPHYFLLDFSHTYFPNRSLANQELLSRFHRGDEYLPQDYADGFTLHHCDLKSIEEYINYKFNRTDAMYKDICNLPKPIPDRCFFKHNKKTKEKLQILSKASYNGLMDLVLETQKDYNEDFLKLYRKIYIKDLSKDISPRVKKLENDIIDIDDVAEFYIESGIKKRKSIEQIKKYFS